MGAPDLHGVSLFTVVGVNERGTRERNKKGPLSTPPWLVPGKKGHKNPGDLGESDRLQKDPFC